MAPAERTNGSVRTITAFLIVGIFVAGVASGVGITVWLTGHFAPDRPPGMPMPKHLPLHRLSLTDDQKEKAHECFERHRPQLEKILDATFPKVDAISEKIEKDIRAILTAEQVKRLDEIQAEHRKYRRGPKGHGPHGPFGKWDDKAPPPPFMMPPGPPGPMQGGSDRAKPPSEPRPETAPPPSSASDASPAS